ncbi:MAG: hypothetical protein H0W70_01960 [Actinobacteria bacterium]|nr:hypothetical protein [Actinomycetota bacterium]
MPAPAATTDLYAVPATIDIPYLNRVFLALDHINGDATRLIVANRRITPEAANLLRSIHTDDEFVIQAEIWNDDIDRGLTKLKPAPGDLETNVVRLLDRRPDCVAVEVDRDYSPALVVGKPPVRTIISLVPGGVEPNHTGWVMALEGTKANKCAA